MLFTGKDARVGSDGEPRTQVEEGVPGCSGAACRAGSKGVLRPDSPMSISGFLFLFYVRCCRLTRVHADKDH